MNDLEQAAAHLKIRVIPIEQPTKLELIVNMKTAKAIGIKFPQSILVAPDRNTTAKPPFAGEALASSLLLAVQEEKYARPGARICVGRGAK